MASGFPPIPVYPTAIDSDYTLYSVYNTSEAALTTDNAAYAEEINIDSGECEIWADNGFANISGELIYWDAVDKVNSRVVKLKRVLRGINGFSQFNAAGTILRGYVVAEHHNQMALGTILTERFIGENFTEDETTLDWRIRNLNAQDPIFNDFDCPDVEFIYNIIQQDSNSGTVITYAVNVTGTFGNLTIAFGDGTTTTIASGTHRYAANAIIDPVVTVSNGDCQIVQTPILRTESGEPEAPTQTPPFTVPIPIAPSIPIFVFPSFTFPSTDLLSPPVLQQCIDLSPINGLSNISFGFNATFPSNITITPISFPSIITFVPSLNIPSFIGFGPISFPSIIGFGPFPSIPPISFPPISVISLTVPPISFPPIEFGTFPSFPVISFSPISIPSTINFGPTPSLPTLIEFGTPPSCIPSIINFGNTPSIPTQITFGAAPTIPSIINFGAAPTIPTEIAFINNPTIPTTINIIGGDIPNVISIANSGIPSVISVDWGTPPSLTCTCVVMCPSSSPMMMRSTRQFMEPDMGNVEIQYDIAGLPSVISIQVPDRPIRIQGEIPSIIHVKAPEIRDIKLLVDDRIPSEINIVAARDLQSVISLVAPSQISMEIIGFPKSLKVEFPDEIPVLKVEFPSEIKVVGFPSSIKIEHDIPSVISVDWGKFPEMPPISLPPVEVKINLAFEKMAEEDAERQCFALIPCKR